MNLPKSRQDELITQEAGAELIIYDLRTNRAVCLNETAAAVYNACDGKTTFEELKERYADDLIYLALDGLRKKNLLDDDAPIVFNRRESLRRVGLASLAALPVITAVVLPVAAQMTSNPGGQPSGSNVTANGTGDSSCQRNLEFQCRSNAITNYMSTPFPVGVGVSCSGTCT